MQASVNLSWQFISLIVLLIGHTVVIAFCAGRVIEHLRFLSTSVDKMNDGFTRRIDTVVADEARQWAEISNHGNRLTIVETRCNMNHDPKAA